MARCRAARRRSGRGSPRRGRGIDRAGARVRFRHPLLRAAVYRAAAVPDRREVHRALAEATDPGADPDRRAWHRACAATGPDEAVAGELERSAARAQGRGGVAAAAAFLQRSAELTPDPARRGARALAAARAKFAAAAPDAAYELLAMAELGQLDELQRAELARLRAQMAFAERRGGDAPRLLLDAAKKLGPLDSGLARETYLEALGAAISAGRLGRGLTVREAAEAARTAAPSAPQPLRPLDLLLDGAATRLTEGYVAGVPPLRRALDALRRHGGRSEADIMGWLPLATIAPELWDDATWHELTARAVGLARDAGALAVLPVALTYRAAVHVHAAEFGAAAGLIQEADAHHGGNRQCVFPVHLAGARRLARRGNPALELIVAAARHAPPGVREGRSGSPGMPLRCCTTAWAATRPPWPAPGGHASTRTWHSSVPGPRRGGSPQRRQRRGVGGPAAARRADPRRRVGVGTRHPGPVTRAAQRRPGCGHPVPGGDRPPRRTRIAVHLARAHLVYGEWLRREQRRVEAREHLRAAHDMFGRFGAAAFAERARRELQATGETVRKRTVDTRDALTVQEAQVARLAAEGHTNPEIGARLFISPRTAEYHLRKVFSKLGISSRRSSGTTWRWRKEDLQKFDVPTLILHGEDDQVVPVNDSARKSAGLIKDAKEIYYPGAPTASPPPIRTSSTPTCWPSSGASYDRHPAARPLRPGKGAGS